MKYTILIILALGVFAVTSPLLAQNSKSEGLTPELFNTVNIAFAGREEAQNSLDWVLARGGTDLAAHLITAMRYSVLGRDELSGALQEITGNTEPKSWFDWMLWQQRHAEIQPHESFLDFKSTVFYSIDRNFSRFFRPDMKFDIRPEEIVWGGVRVDGIPALDNPKHISISEASYLSDDDEVFGVEINGDARAYPLRIMGWHEMFNDVVGGVPVSLAYCTLCNAGILFEGDYKGREEFDVKEPFTFGSSGFLYQSNKLMYDRQTDSLWNQFTGEPVSGKLLGSGIELKIRPVVITSWGEWKKQNPKTKVLSLKTGFKRDYGSGVVYSEYFSSSDLMFPALGDQSRTLKEKEEIFGMRLEGGIKVWPLDAFKNGRVLNDRVGAVNVVLIGDTKTRTVRAYERQDYEFDENLKTSKGQWNLTENALHGPNKQKLKRLPGHIAYWFAWAGYLGDRSELFKE